MDVLAAVLEEYRSPLRVQPLTLDEPRAGEVLVRVVATGVCHTDALARDTDLPYPVPGVLGHEGAGVVEAVGDGVSKVAAGDRVVIGWPWCGVCRNCIAGRQRYCEQMPVMVTSGARSDGSTAFRRPGGGPVHGHFFGQSSFATRTLTWERSVVRVAADAPLELLAPLACGFSTGAGAIFNALRPPAGSSIAVFGTGAVGLAALLAAGEQGCSVIIGVDRVPSRLQFAQRFGATETIDATTTDPVAAIREITDGRGADYTLECTGNVAVLRQAVDALAMPGVCGVIGGAPAGTEFVMDHLTVLWGRQIRGILGGEGQSESLIPTLVALQAAGRFPFDEMIERFELEAVNEAMAASAHGEVLKPVLLMPAA